MRSTKKRSTKKRSIKKRSIKKKKPTKKRPIKKRPIKKKERKISSASKNRILKIIRFQDKLKPKFDFNINFTESIKKFFNSFFQKISDSNPHAWHIPIENDPHRDTIKLKVT